MNTVLTYEGAPITFENKDGKMMVNATQMAKPFGKQPKDWLKTQSSKDFIETLSKVKKILFADLQKVTAGAPENGGGTWFHEDVALEFARWLQPKFAIWCNDHIKELLKTGSTSINATRYQDVIEAKLIAIKYISEGLRMNDNSKLAMYQSVNAQHQLNLPLPVYTKAEDVKFSATTLLERIGSSMKAVEFNKKLAENGYLEQKTRTSKNGERKFWSLTDKGMEYGENQVSPKNPKETQPSYYEKKFKELYDSVA